ncbi:MAG: (Fe-S)-binding protein [Desulfobacterales bacterium]|nr:(Fe-S)-binding protein [Desulfobacterales bacterium]
MADIEELVRLLKELEEELVHCTRCGMCQAVCPLYGATGRETDVARGKIVLVENLSKEILDDPEAVKQRLDRCLLCGSCEAACPGGVPIMDIFLKARAIITGYLGLSPVKKAIFRGLLSNPDRFDKLLKWMARLQGPFSRQVSETLGSSCARFMSPVIGDRHFMPIASEAWHKKGHRQFLRPRDPGLRVVFYPGCLVDRIFPRVAEAVMKVLDFHEVDVFAADRVPCCGIPALSAGDRQSFEKLVRQNMDILDSLDFDYLVTPCATCTATIRKFWPAMIEAGAGGLTGEIQEKVLAASEKTRDINELLVDVLGVQAPAAPASGAKSLTYHDPCHLKKSLGISRQPRTVLAAAGDVNFAEMREPDRCCGMGGSFNLQHYGLSDKIGQKKLAAILETGADTVATGCPACMLQLTDLLSRGGHALAVKHPVEVYAEALQQRPGLQKPVDAQKPGNTDYDKATETYR